MSVARSAAPSRAASRAPSRAPTGTPAQNGAPEPIFVQLPPRDAPPIYIDAPARPRSKGPVAAPGLSGGRGMFKRLIVACDGTWLNSDNGMVNGKLAVPSNITRISRAIKAVSQDGVPQIVNYHFGVGSQGGIVDRIVGGSTGEGLGENVREAYSFLANNYHPGDEIFLLGFSRGAFTARSIAGLMGEVGLLTKKGLHCLPEVFKDVQHGRDERYVPKNPNIPFPNKPSVDDPRYATEMERRGLTRLDIPIKAIAVWDTVGSLGTPRLGWLTKVGLQSNESKEMSFYDTKLSHCIENAFQALALDERRSAFSPAVWEKPEGNKTTLRQVWFPGVHSNIGGGYDDQQIANITLAWMMSQLEPFLDMRDEYLFEQEAENDKYYRDERQRIRPWSFGEVYNSLTGVYSLAGGQYRTPGVYHAVDPDNGRTTGRPLRQTNEYIHPSARTRYRLNGPGVGDKGIYECKALTDNYKLVVDYGVQSAESGDPDIFWKYKGSSKEDGAVKVLPEAPLWRLERELAESDPKTYDYVKRPPATRAEGRSKTKGKSKGRPVSADFSNGRMRGTRTGGSFIETGDGAAEYPPPPRGSRRNFTETQVRSRSRPRSVDSFDSRDRETDIRDGMPHRRAKDKTWWEGESLAYGDGAPSAARGGGSSRMRSPRRSSMRVWWTRLSALGEENPSVYFERLSTLEEQR